MKRNKKNVNPLSGISNLSFLLIALALLVGAAGVGVLFKNQSGVNQTAYMTDTPVPTFIPLNSDGSNSQKQGTFTFDNLTPTVGQANNIPQNLRVNEIITPEELDQDCTYTQGFWKTHPEAWPVDSLSLGNTSYTKTQLLNIFNLPVESNGLVSLSHQMIASKLNVSNNTSTAAIVASISDADSLVGDLVVPPVGTGYLSTLITSPLTNDLDEFNNGLSGPPHCN